MENNTPYQSGTPQVKDVNKPNTPSAWNSRISSIRTSPSKTSTPLPTKSCGCGN